MTIALFNILFYRYKSYKQKLCQYSYYIFNLLNNIESFKVLIEKIQKVQDYTIMEIEMK